MHAPNASRRGARSLRALAVVALLVATAFASGAAVDTATAAGSTSPPVAVYEDDPGTLTAVYGNGTTQSLGVSPTVVGPMRNLDDDGALEIPYTTSNGELRVVDTAGDTATLASDASSSVKTRLGVGDWDGDGTPSVFYTTSNGKLGRVTPGESATVVTGPDGKTLATNSPVGVADFDGDGDADLVYLGSSSTVKYYDGQTVEGTGNSNLGSNNGIGIGPPVDVGGDGTARVPLATGSNNIGLMAADGTVTTLTSNGPAAKAGVAGGNWTGDSAPEVLFVGTNERLRWATLDGETGTVDDASGTPITVTGAPGVSPATPPPEPRISNYAVTNPDGRTIQVAFDSSDSLANVSVAVTDTETDTTVATLTERDFTASGSAPTHYEATYTAASDGTYAATLQTAADADGADGADGERGTVEIATPTPTVSNVTLTAVNDDDGIVGDGDELRVTATVANESALDSVVATASSFGVDSITLDDASGEYRGTLVVDGSKATSGSHAVTVRATNEYDHTDRATSTTVRVDVTPPRADAGPNRTVEAGTSVGFDGDGSTDNTNVETYRWSFGDGTSATGRTATHTYENAGTYTATLTAVDAVGQTDTDTRTITVTDSSTTTTTTTTEPTTTSTTTSTTTEPTTTTTTTTEPTTTSTTTTEPTTTTTEPTTTTTTSTTTETTTTTTEPTTTTSTTTEPTTTATAEPTTTTPSTTTESTTTTTTTLTTDPTTTAEPTPTTITEPTATTTTAEPTATPTTASEPTTSTTTTESTTTTTTAEPTTTTESTTSDETGSDGSDSSGTDSGGTDSGGTDSGGTDSGGARSTSETADGGAEDVETSVVVTERVRVNVTRANAGEAVAVDVPANASERAGVSRLVVTPERNGSFSLTARRLADAPEDAVSLEARAGVEPVRYVSVRSSLDAANVSGTTLTLDANASALDGRQGNVALYRLENGSWSRYATERVVAENGTVTVRSRVPATGVFALASRAAVVSVTDATVADRTGDEVLVAATVRNTGRVMGTRSLALTVNGTAVARANVTVPPGETRTVRFSRDVAGTGRYAFAVNDTRAGAFSVTRTPGTATPTQTPVRKSEGGLSAAFFGTVAILAGGALLVARRLR